MDKGYLTQTLQAKQEKQNRQLGFGQTKVLLHNKETVYRVKNIYRVGKRSCDFPVSSTL